MAVQVVWFKRDLRLTDHVPLLRAARQGPCVCLYVYEPELIASDEFDASHLEFINQSLGELDHQLMRLGSGLTFRVGKVVEILESLHRSVGIETLWSHEETGNHLTYRRDLAVAKWAKTAGVRWTEIPQNGVVRRLQSREGWSQRRDRFMDQTIRPPPSSLVDVGDITKEEIRTAEDFGLEPTTKTELQRGGSRAAKQILDSFLEHRGENYQREMSSPVTAWNSCSRLSPSIAWGCLSIREINQAVRDRRVAVETDKAFGKPTGSWLGSLRAVESRLSWHCHFMQKLEDQPSIEFENMSRSFDGLREECFNQSYFDAWCSGRTGYPMVDACMRALHQHSWINFRMRAMLISFASYHLWLHWRPTALFLAKHFLDFEPGIHFPQVQMQSGTTGINSVRIYSPIKQVHDQDPTGQFIRRFVPELANVSPERIAEPHKMSLSEQSQSGCRIGKDYPKPIVTHSVAYREARDRMFAARGTQQARQEAKSVMSKHGSRKGPSTRRMQRSRFGRR